MTTKINIAIAEDQHLFRESLDALLSTENRFNVIAKEENGKLFLEKMYNLNQLPHIALIDLNMPDMNGMDLTKIVHKEFPAIKVIILSMYRQDRLIAKMIQSGACAYLNKNCDADELFKSIDLVYKDGLYLTSQTLSAIQNSSVKTTKDLEVFQQLTVRLTKREIEILDLICKELNNIEIAKKLYLSVRTVEGHRTNLLMKTECRNTAGLVLFAIKHGLLQLPHIS